MNRLHETFPDRRHVLLPVIHVEDEKQALREAQVAREADCDGVFLINHAVASDELLAIHAAVAKKIPNWWIGVNCLDLSPVEVFEAVSNTVAGVWVDNAHVDERTEKQAFAECVLATQERKGWRGLYFGGVAFKYQRTVENIESAARTASRYMDVVTTSGAGTGESARVEKIAQMKAALGDFPLAIASGITPENIFDYLPHADCFLVATGISKSWNEFNPAKVKALVKAARCSA